MKAFKRWTNAEATNCLLMVVQPVESQLSEKLAHCEGGAKGVWGVCGSAVDNGKS